MAALEPSQAVITRGSASKLRFGGANPLASTLTFFLADARVATVSNANSARGSNKAIPRVTCLNIFLLLRVLSSPLGTAQESNADGSDPEIADDWQIGGIAAV